MPMPSLTARDHGGRWGAPPIGRGPRILSLPPPLGSGPLFSTQTHNHAVVGFAQVAWGVRVASPGERGGGGCRPPFPSIDGALAMSTPAASSTPCATSAPGPPRPPPPAAPPRNRWESREHPRRGGGSGSNPPRPEGVTPIPHQCFSSNPPPDPAPPRLMADHFPVRLATPRPSTTGFYRRMGRSARGGPTAAPGHPSLPDRLFRLMCNPRTGTSPTGIHPHGLVCSTLCATLSRQSPSLWAAGPRPCRGGGGEGIVCQVAKGFFWRRERHFHTGTRHFPPLAPMGWPRQCRLCLRSLPAQRVHPPTQDSGVEWGGWMG